jgi:hypothetical protein
MKLSAATALATALAAAFVVVAPISASPPQSAAGSAILTGGVITDVHTGGGNTHIDSITNGVMTGTLNGTLLLETHSVFHPNGHRFIHAFLTFDGVTPCGPGTFTARVEGEGVIVGLSEGHITTIHDDTNTANIHLELEFAQFGPTFTYSGGYHCG